MNAVSVRQIRALSLFKLKGMFYNIFASTTLFLPLIIVVGYNALFKMQMETSKLPTGIILMVSSFGVFFNLCNSAIATPLIMIAEEKEKNTLRNLMVSSIRPFDYLVGNAIPIFLVTFVIQMSFIPILHAKQGDIIQILIYAGISTVGLLTSIFLGFCFGLLAKNQISGSFLPMPLIIIMGGVPVLASKFEAFKKAEDFLYSCIVNDAMSSLVRGEMIELSFVKILALIVSLVLSIGVFVYLFKRNGFEKD